MNWRQGLFRLWLIGALGWMAIWFIMVNMACHLQGDGRMTCRTLSSHWIVEWINRTSWTYFKIGLVGFTLPALVLVVGAAVVWATSRRT